MYQIPPVAQRFISMPPKDKYAALGPSSWDIFQYTELTKIMRQQGDKRFAEMLNMVRNGAHTNEDVDLLKTMNIETSSISTDILVLHVYPLNAEVNKHNDFQLQQLPHTPVCLIAVDKKIFVYERLQFVRRRAIYIWVTINCKTGHRCTRQADLKCRRVR